MERGRVTSRRRPYVRISSVGLGRRVSNTNSSDLRNSENYGAEHVDQVGTTEVQMETFAFLWSLQKYSLVSESTEEIMSPQFGDGSKFNHSWQVKLIPKKMIDGEQYVSAHLLLTSFGDGDNSENKTIKARFSISLLDADGRLVKQGVRGFLGSSYMEACAFKERSVWGFDKFVPVTELVSPTRGILGNDELKIQVRIWIQGDLKHGVLNGGARNRSPPEDEKIKKRKDRLASDFEKMYKNPTFADITIITASKTFPAHKIILAARSSVLSAMFSASMMEKEFGKVEILDFDDEAVEAMLEYIYTCDTALLEKRAPDLLQLAEKYDIPGLKEDCEYIIAENLTFENAAELLVLADLYRANILKPRVIDYMNRNKESVKETATFQKIKRTHANVFVNLFLSE